MEVLTKLLDLAAHLKNAAWLYSQNDSCYVCNIRQCQSLLLRNEELSSKLVDSYIHMPLCARCYAYLPWRQIDDNVVELAWRSYDLHCNCLISTYYQGEICNLIRLYKFHQAAYLAKLFAYILALTYWRYKQAVLMQNIRVSAKDLTKVDYVSFVPLHAERKKERSYDQAELLAKNCALYLKLPCQASLLRVKATNRQSSLAHRVERLENVKSAFSVLDEKKVYGKNILLLDDVVSTGSSLLSAAKELYAKGAYGVLCLAVSSNLTCEAIHYVDGYKSS